jgi:hypothetical protein
VRGKGKALRAPRAGGRPFALALIL